MQTLLTTHRCHTFTVANSDHCCKTDKPQYWENQTYPFSTLTPHLFTPRPLPTTTTTHTTCPYLRIVLSRLVVYDCDPMDCGLPASSVHGDSPGKNTGVGCHALLQEIFPTQGTESRSPTLQVDSLPSEPPGTLINKIPNYLHLIPASQLCFPLQIFRPTQQQSKILDSKTKRGSPET